LSSAGATPGQGQEGWKRVRQVYQGEDRQQFFRQVRRELKKHGYAAK